MKKGKLLGFAVLEHCDEYEQVLAVMRDECLPKDGILTWADKEHPRVLFETRFFAKRVIDATEHYRLAFSRTDLPEKKYCKVEPVYSISPLP